MKIALAQFNYHVGNLKANVAKIKNGISRAKRRGADLVVFSELAVCGYPPKDLLLYEGFIQNCEHAIKKIARECKGIAAIVGAPARNTAKKGKPLFNTAFFMANGKVTAQVHKTLLPFYDVFDEYRYFEPALQTKAIEYKGVTIALTICEDTWNELPVKGRYLYPISPLEKLYAKNTKCIINIAASPFFYNQREERKRIFKAATSRYKLPLFYVNTLGANTDLIFDGGSMVIGTNSKVLDEMNYFSEDLALYELSAHGAVKILEKQKSQQTPKDTIQLIHDALVLGIRDYFEKNDLSKAVIGLSGGIDSAVVLALAVKALGNKNVHSVMLSSKYTSKESLRDAMQLIKKMDCPHETISIEPGISAAHKALAKVFTGKKKDITDENIQSRMRGLLLMAISNKMGYLLLNTSNKSELATGYGTLYGDMSGALSVIGDVYKTQVYELARYINAIPANIIAKAPTAELKPNQKDSDSLPEYELLDKILYQYIELEKSPAQIQVKGADKLLIKKVTDMVNRNEYKRHQAPPVLRISSKAFGAGRRIPIVAKYS